MPENNQSGSKSTRTFQIQDIHAEPRACSSLTAITSYSRTVQQRYRNIKIVTNSSVQHREHTEKANMKKPCKLVLQETTSATKIWITIHHIELRY